MQKSELRSTSTVIARWLRRVSAVLAILAVLADGIAQGGVRLEVQDDECSDLMVGEGERHAV